MATAARKVGVEQLSFEMPGGDSPLQAPLPVTADLMSEPELDQLVAEGRLVRLSVYITEMIRLFSMLDQDTRAEITIGSWMERRYEKGPLPEGLMERYGNKAGLKRAAKEAEDGIQTRKSLELQTFGIMYGGGRLGRLERDEAWIQAHIVLAFGRFHSRYGGRETHKVSDREDRRVRLSTYVQPPSETSRLR